MAPPTSIPSAKSPNGQELDLHTYQQLKDVAHSNLKSRAMNLRDVLKSKMLQGSLLQDHGATLKASSDQETLIKWIMTAQVLLLQHAGDKQGLTEHDFGLPVEKADQEVQFYDGNLPSIKKNHTSIMAGSPKKGPHMHDTPPRPAD